MSENMTKDDIIRMAREAGFSLQESFVRTEFRHERDGYAVQFCLEPLERFAHKVIEHFLDMTGQYVTNDASREAAIQAAVEAEREACATICDELEAYWAAEKDVALLNGDVDLSNASSGEPRAARAIATAIRARGEK